MERIGWVARKMRIHDVDEAVPQELKPTLFCGFYGTTKVAP